MAQRKQAIEVAMKEREELKREAAEVRRKAKELRKKDDGAAPAPAKPAAPAAAAPAAAAPAPVPTGGSKTMLASPSGEVVMIKGREEAVRLMDLMMADEEFMKYQESLMQDMEAHMTEEIERGGRLRSQSFVGRAGMRHKEVSEDDAEVSGSASSRVDAVSGLTAS